MKGLKNPPQLRCIVFLFKICTLCIICILWYLVPEGKLWQALAVFIFLLFPRCLIQIPITRRSFFCTVLTIQFFKKKHRTDIWSIVIHFGHTPCFLQLWLLRGIRLSQPAAPDFNLVKLGRLAGKPSCGRHRASPKPSLEARPGDRREGRPAAERGGCRRGVLPPRCLASGRRR